MKLASNRSEKKKIFLIQCFSLSSLILFTHCTASCNIDCPSTHSGAPTFFLSMGCCNHSNGFIISGTAPVRIPTNSCESYFYNHYTTQPADACRIGDWGELEKERQMGPAHQQCPDRSKEGGGERVAVIHNKVYSRLHTTTFSPNV